MGGELLSIPHVRKSDKGQDILIVHFHEGECSVTIGEDKASDDARAIVRSQVFPEFEQYETGCRDAELESATLAILQRNLNSEQSQQVIVGVLWERARKYRIAVSASADGPNDKDPHDLFAGYEDAVAGDDNRRRAETITIPELRSWFDCFAEDVTNHLEKMLEEIHV